MFVLDWKTNFFKLIDGEWNLKDDISLRLKLTGEQASRLVNFNPFLKDPSDIVNINLNDRFSISYDEVISKISKKKRLFVLFTDGEPFIHKDFKKILGYCKKNNIITMVETSLPGFDNIEKAKEYKNLIDMFIVPIYSYKEEVYESISQVRGSYKNMFKSFDNIEKYMPKTGLSFTITLTRAVVTTLYDTVAFFYRRYPGVPLFITPSLESKETSPSFSEIRDAYRATIRDFGHRNITLYTPLCFMYPFHDRPNVGEIEGVAYDGLGILGNKPKEVFYDKMSERYKPEGCKACKLHSLCKGFINLYTDIYNPDEEIIPVINEKYDECENGNCERCGRQLNDNSAILQTKFYVIEGDELKYEQNEPLTRNLCLDCMDIITDKLKYIN